jgi:hypothetical protein
MARQKNTQGSPLFQGRDLPNYLFQGNGVSVVTVHCLEAGRAAGFEVGLVGYVKVQFERGHVQVRVVPFLPSEVAVGGEGLRIRIGKRVWDA